MTELAILGGTPAFPEGVPFVRPAVPEMERVVARVAPSYERGMLTNGPVVAELEDQAAQRLGVEHVVAVASCTAGLMLAVRVLGAQGTVVMPSFTFSASAHAVAWNGLQPVFAECEAHSFQLDIDDAKGRLGGAGLVLATHVFGAPCAPRVVEEVAASAGVPVVFDAAHCFGSRHDGRPIGGFGDVEVFSLTPTKPLVAGEGGLVATDRADVAEGVRIGRDYANPGDYDTRFVGLNARMSEMHAAIALESLRDFDAHLARRRALAARYTRGFEGIAGLRVQHVEPGDESTFKDFTIAIDADAFGVTRDELVHALRAEGVGTRNYFDPPVHRQQAYAPAGAGVELPVTDRVARSVVSLPIYPGLDDAVVDRIIELVGAVPARAAAVRAACGAALATGAGAPPAR